MTSATKPPADRMLIDRPEQLTALTSPVRVELLELIGTWGPCAVADVAVRMGRAPDSLYYHVKKLVDVGLLERAGERRAAHRTEALYRLPARELLMPRTYEDPAALEASHKAIDSILRLAGRELKVALEDERVPDEGPQRSLYGRRMRASLTKKALRELNRHVNAIEELFAEAALKPPRAERVVAVTLTMTPVPVSERS